MAQFPKVNPAIDGNSASFFGKVPDYVEINFGSQTNILSAQNLGPNGAWPIAIQTIEQLSTIEVLGTLAANVVLLSAGGNIGTGNVGVRMLLTGVNSEVNLQSNLQSAGPFGNGFIVIGNSSVGYSNVNFSGATVAVTTIGNVQGVTGSETFYF